jgi:hypothetical protein
VREWRRRSADEGNGLGWMAVSGAGADEERAAGSRRLMREGNVHQRLQDCRWRTRRRRAATQNLSAAAAGRRQSRTKPQHAATSASSLPSFPSFLTSEQQRGEGGEGPTTCPPLLTSPKPPPAPRGAFTRPPHFDRSLLIPLLSSLNPPSPTAPQRKGERRNEGKTTISVAAVDVVVGAAAGRQMCLGSWNTILPPPFDYACLLCCLLLGSQKIYWKERKA